MLGWSHFITMKPINIAMVFPALLSSPERCGTHPAARVFDVKMSANPFDAKNFVLRTFPAQLVWQRWDSACDAIDALCELRIENKVE